MLGGGIEELGRRLAGGFFDEILDGMGFGFFEVFPKLSKGAILRLSKLTFSMLSGFVFKLSKEVAVESCIVVFKESDVAARRASSAAFSLAFLLFSAFLFLFSFHSFGLKI